MTPATRVAAGGDPAFGSAVTVNRLCGSSMQALHDVARMIMTGDAQACSSWAASSTWVTSR